MNRNIIHCDLDAFFCAVEITRDPSLAGIPFAVGGRPNERGVIASCSYRARRYGIHSAMPVKHAIRLCPQLRVITPEHKLYSQYSKKVMALLHRITPSVEQLSIDEAFLDVSDIAQDPADLALNLQKGIKNGISLPCSFGIATNKLVAKIANNVGKASKSKESKGPPETITVVPPGKEAEFLAPLPVEALWGVGPKTAARFAQENIHTIGDIAKMPERELVQLFGKNGGKLSVRSRGIDNRPIQTSHEAKSISQETTFPADVSSRVELEETLQQLTRKVVKRLHKSDLSCTTIKLKLRWSDFTTLSRQITLTQETDKYSEIFRAASQLFEKVWKKGKPVRLVGVGVSGLGPPNPQISLWQVKSKKDRRLETAIQKLQSQFGDEIISRGDIIE